MKTNARQQNVVWRVGVWMIAVLAFTLTLPAPASAALGGDTGSIQADQVHMKGGLRVTRAQAFSVHAIQVPSGTVVREFVSPAGKVFAVAWQGPSLPDLRQLLGSYFEQFQQAAQTNRRGHGPLIIEQPGLVVQSGGHMRSFVGRAYIPDMVPEGVRLEEIR
jgi:hypothetical protein